MTLLVAPLAADHTNRQRESWTFHRHLIRRLPTRIAATIQEERRLFLWLAARDFASEIHQKRSVLQPHVAVSRAGLEPQEPHPLRGI